MIEILGKMHEQIYAMNTFPNQGVIGNKIAQR
jgi:hypothetical protein